MVLLKAFAGRLPVPPIEVGPTSNSRDVLTAVEEGHDRKCERVQALVGGHLVSDLGLKMSLF